MSDEYKDLIDRLDRPALQWRPWGDLPEGTEPETVLRDAVVTGTIVDIDDTRSSEWGPFRMVTVIDGDGNYVNVAGIGTVLKNRFGSLKAGDRLAVRYNGEQPSSIEGANDYHDYTVVVDRPDPVT